MAYEAFSDVAREGGRSVRDRLARHNTRRNVTLADEGAAARMKKRAEVRGVVGGIAGAALPLAAPALGANLGLSEETTRLLAPAISRLVGGAETPEVIPAAAGLGAGLLNRLSTAAAGLPAGLEGPAAGSGEGSIAGTGNMGASGVVPPFMRRSPVPADSALPGFYDNPAPSPAGESPFIDPEMNWPPRRRM